MQIQYDGKKAWNSIGTAKVQGRRLLHVRRQAEAPRLDRSYRVVKPADNKATKGISKARDVEVYGWDWLDSRTPSASRTCWRSSRCRSTATTTVHTLYSTTTKTTGYVEYTLGRKCLLLDATFGLSDRTATGGTGSIKVHHGRHRRSTTTPSSSVSPRPDPRRRRRLPGADRLRPARTAPSPSPRPVRPGCSATDRHDGGRPVGCFDTPRAAPYSCQLWQAPTSTPRSSSSRRR